MTSGSGSISGGFVPRKEVKIQSSAPNNPQQGDWWYDTSSNEMKFYTGSKWEQPEGMTNAEQTRFLETINDVAQNRFENSLAQENYDDLFYDVFVNQDKISSNSGLTLNTGSSGNVEMSSTLIESWEDGNIGDKGSWGDTSVLSINSSNSTDGSNSLQFDFNSSNNNSTELTLDSPASIGTWQIKRKDKSGVNYKPTFQVRGQNGNDLVHIQVHYPNNEFNVNGTKQANAPTQGNWYTVEIVNIDYDNETLDVKLDGTTVASGISFNQTGASDIGKYQTGGSGGDDANTWMDEMTKTGGGSGNYVSTTKSLGFTPTKAIVIQDASINSNGDLTYDISDSNGNTKTVQQSEVGNEVSLSFDNGDVDIKPVLDPGDGKTTLNEVGVLFV